MMRVIVTPAVLPPSALAELKDWLGVTTTADDASLSALLATALEVCTDFIGLIPIAATVEETIPLPTDHRAMPTAIDWQQQCYPDDWRRGAIRPGWHQIDTRPVSAVVAVFVQGADGTRTALTSDQYQVQIEADGTCTVRVSDAGGFHRAVVRFTAGLAPDWASLPVPLRHGIMRLAAHQYRTRETGGADAVPPASVSALWRPWRRVRLV